MNTRKSYRKRKKSTRLSVNQLSKHSGTGKKSCVHHTKNISEMNNGSGKVSKSNTFFCVACNRSFNKFKTKDDFLKNHILMNLNCKNAAFECTNCKRIFLTELALNKHYVNVRECSLKVNENKSRGNFAVSEVRIAVQSPQLNNKESQQLSNPRGSRHHEMIHATHHHSVLKNRQETSHHGLLKNKGVYCINNSLPGTSTSTSKDVSDCHVSSKSNSTIDVATFKVTKGFNQRSKNVIATEVGCQSSTSSNTEGDSVILSKPFCNEEMYDLNMYMNLSVERDSNHNINQYKDDHSLLLVDVDSNTVSNLAVNNDMEDNMSQDTNQENSNMINSKIESYHLLNMSSKQLGELPSPHVDKEYSDAISLLKVLLKRNISLSSYRDFMRWKYGDDVKCNSLSLNSVMESAIHRVYGKTLGERLKPIVENLSLPSGREASIVKFNFDALLFDLLSDKDLMAKENLIFDTSNINNPFMCKETQFYGDIDSTEYYRETLKEYNIDSKESVLCPLIFYLDELKIDAFGRLGLEPLVFTLSIYNRKTRNLNKAWRNLGYMPNFDALFGSTSYTPDEKANDYHACLKFLLSDVITFQNQQEGVFWDFRLVYNKEVKVYRRRLYVPLCYIIGDAKGNDLLCVRYGSRLSTCIA